MDRNTPVIENLENLTQPGRRKKLRRILTWIIPVGVVFAILLAWHLHDGSQKIRYVTKITRLGNLTVTVTATGNLLPINQVVVGSELSGIVKSVDVDYNDHVKVGQILATLDTSKLSAQILQSKAALASAKAKVLETQATVNQTRVALERLRKAAKLSQNRAVSQSDLDTAEAAFARAKADDAVSKAAVAQAEATLKLNETDLAKAQIHSPINGIVLERSVEPGQTVAASLQAPVLFTLAEDLSKMELDVNVDEADVGQVQAGQSATFTVDAYPDRTYPAKITQVRYGSKTTNGVVTYEAILKVDNSDLSLRPGMTATADITVDKVEQALLIPNAALRFTPTLAEQTEKSNRSILSKLFPRPRHRRPTKQREEVVATMRTQNVWVLADGRPSSVKVTTGLTDGTVTQIVKGDLKPGAHVIVDTETTEQ